MFLCSGWSEFPACNNRRWTSGGVAGSVGGVLNKGNNIIPHEQSCLYIHSDCIDRTHHNLSTTFASWYQDPSGSVALQPAGAVSLSTRLFSCPEDVLYCHAMVFECK